MISNRKKNRLLNLANQLNRAIDFDDSKFLGENAAEYFDFLFDKLINREMANIRTVYGAIRIMAMLRHASREAEFISILQFGGGNDDIKIRSYCYSLLVMLLEQNQLEENKRREIRRELAKIADSGISEVYKELGSDSLQTKGEN